MNALATREARPLRALTADEAREPLLGLFSAYDEPFRDRNAPEADKMLQARVHAYLLGLEGLPGWAIQQAVTDFIRSKVERPARRKGMLPNVEELAGQAREHVEREAARQAAQRRNEPEEPTSTASPEERARMGFKMDLLRLGLERSEVSRVKQANDEGLRAMVALANSWGVKVPDAVLQQIG